MTHERALVWDYSATGSPIKVVSLSLQFGLRTSDPLPRGAIVRNGPTNDFGVVALAPSTGKITFWENIDNADTRNLLTQRQQGVEGSIRLHSGETIIDLIDVEHAGFVLVLSSGRLAQLTLRDPQGRPNITTTVLTTPNGSGSSFFGLKGLLSGSIRKTIASVKARSTEPKGHMQVVSATRNGLFQVWDLNWSGQHRHEWDVDVHMNILSALQADIAPEVRNQQDVQILDFAIREHLSNRDAINALVLVALSGRDSVEYSLLEIVLSQEKGAINRAIPVRNFHQPQIPHEPSGTLLLPQPGHTAYVQFPGAIFIASLAEPEESPDAQILADSGRSSLPFQDTVYFRNDLHVVGSGLEQTTWKDQNATALIFVQEFGLLQIIASAPDSSEKDEEHLKVTARGKLEQATFYSTIPGNILDFSTKSRFSFSEAQTAQAALDISTKILASDYGHIEEVTSSMDDQFKKRAFALRTLISHLRAEYPPLPFETKWQLLWQAEKLAATHQLWLWYQEKLQDQQAHPDSYPDDILMGDITRALNERYKTLIQPELGETDTIRHFFLKNAESLAVLIPWGWHYLRTFYMKEGGKDQSSIMQRLSEGIDVFLVTLGTAYEFRTANAELYGIDPESIDDSLLKPAHGYDVLPQVWTSTHNIVSSLRSIIDVGRNLAVENYEEGFQEVIAQKIAKDQPQLVKLGCQTHVERFRWALAQPDEKTRQAGRSLQDEWNNKVRPGHINGLMMIGLATDGMRLAEQYHDMPTLVNLVWGETNWLESEKASTRSKMEQAESTVKLNRIRERVNKYFDKYGDAWANAFYSKYINSNQAAQLFMKECLSQPALTKFLREDPTRARLRWINEVCGEKNYEAAAGALFEAGSKQETNSWCQRVELSMAKLAMLCKPEQKQDGGKQPQAPERKDKSKAERVREQRFQSVQHQLEYAKIRDEIYEQLLPIITGALDEESAVELLMAEFGQGRLRDRPAHQSVLKEGFENLIHNKVIDPALMIDILTLMNTDDSEESSPRQPLNEFHYAFRVLIINWYNIHRTTRDGLLKLVWKRLCIKDDWATINNTKDISDAQLNDFVLSTAVGWTFQGLCEMTGKSTLSRLSLTPPDFATAADPGSRVAWPKELHSLLGAGATHGELCVRFGSEDLREPIIKDNLLDDDILREHLEKNRLNEWFNAAYMAAKKAVGAKSTLSNEQYARVIPNIGGEDERETVPEAGGSGAESQDVEMQGT